jgi:deoxyribodipyrimidine photolyase-related protein
VRHLVLFLGDQLDRRSAALDGFDPTCDAIWMAEVAEEATHVWSHKARIAIFLSAMRHFRDWLRQQGYTVHYHALDDSSKTACRCSVPTKTRCGRASRTCTTRACRQRSI